MFILPDLPIKFQILTSFLSHHFFLRISYSKILIERFFEKLSVSGFHTLVQIGRLYLSSTVFLNKKWRDLFFWS